MEKKDYFSGHAGIYAAFRPTYPEELYRFILTNLGNRSCAWDCATGNGQVARFLANHFRSVCATDISQQQIDQASPADNIVYSVSAAEKSPFADHQFNLITVAQALHWLNVESFYNEARRTGARGSLLAVWGYALPEIAPMIDKLLFDFYENKVGPFWDPARRLVENHYRDIAFPFEIIPSPAFRIRTDWSDDQFAGYISSWSSTQKYIQANGTDPVPDFRQQLKSFWKHGDIKQVSFPVFLKLGKIHPA